jgi:hypothetical protein
MNNIETTVLQVVEKLEELASQNDSLWFNQQVLNQVNILRQALEQPPREDKQPCNPSCAPGYCYCKEMTEPKQEQTLAADEHVDTSEKIIGWAMWHDNQNPLTDTPMLRVEEPKSYCLRAPLYVKQLQREWVGFKDVADIRKLANSLKDDFSWIEFAEAIETELKARNKCQTYQKP